jgi:gliding motility-associated lipoprotein GldH
MRICILICLCSLFITACDESRYYEKNAVFGERYWLASEKPEFEFEISDSTKTYNLMLMVRNESDYPYANLYYSWLLLDANGKELSKKLVSEFLFDQKTGRPLGSSGLGAIYDHRFPILSGYTFPRSGKYILRYEQFMRTDTLKGILAVGIRIEQPSAQ